MSGKDDHQREFAGRPWTAACYNSVVMELRPVTPDNFRACVEMTVRPEQRDFVAPNLNSLAEAYVYPAGEARLIYRDDEPVGFVLFHPVEPERPADGHCIVRFMIDQRHQGQGLGRPALRAAVDWIRREHRVDRVRLSVVPSNDRARALYRSEGFEATGEIVMVLER
jgi:diamine N-acetyltransferase